VRIVDQRREGLDACDRAVGARVEEGGDRSVADAAPLVQAREGLVDAEIVLVPPEPGGDARVAGGLLELLPALLELRVDRLLADLVEGGEELGWCDRRMVRPPSCEKRRILSMCQASSCGSR
jgi:hypothetical protein